DSSRSIDAIFTEALIKAGSFPSPNTRALHKRDRSKGNSANRRSPRRRRVCRLFVHHHMPGLGGDAIEPGADVGKAGEVVVALVREVGVGVERDVGDGVAVGCEVAVLLEVVL